MAPYNYTAYYDPAGGQGQPQGYTQQGAGYSNTNAPDNGFASANYTYSNVSYGPALGLSTPASDNNSNYATAASALRSLSGQEYGQGGNSNANVRTQYEGQYDHTNWRSSNPPTNTPSNRYQMPNRSQAQNSPVYPTQNALTTREAHAQPTYLSESYKNSSSHSNPISNHLYSTHTPQPSLSQVPQQQRYASPLHAVQVQQNHRQQRHSPQIDQRHLETARQQTASAGPTAMTVDPSQVYDNRAELEWKAANDVKRRRAREAAEAARQAQAEAEKLAVEKKAEEERAALKKRVEEQRLATERKEAEKAERTRRAVEAEAKRSAQKVKKRKERRHEADEKSQSESAANALQRMASGDDGPSANDDEVEMRAMFRKMREFNQRNPAMLAKLWSEEHKSHTVSQSPQPMPDATPITALPDHSIPMLQPPTQHQNTTSASASPAPAELTFKPFVTQSSTIARSEANTVSTQSADVQSQASKAHSNTPWPPNKKNHLAEAAAKWLQALPENAEKTVSVKDVLRCLDENPSYIVLCESLGSYGLRFDRAKFARELLRTVPEIKAQPPTVRTLQVTAPSNASEPVLQQKELITSNGQSPPAIPSTTQTSSHARKFSSDVSHNTPSFSSLTEVAREINKMGHDEHSHSDVRLPQTYQQQYGPPYLFQEQISPSNFTKEIPHRIDVSSVHTAETPDIKPSPPTRPPVDKEEAARKRNFSELIDLTDNHDSDDDVPPRKMIQASSNELPSATVPIATQGTPNQFHLPGQGVANLQHYQFHNGIQNPGTHTLSRVPTVQMVALPHQTLPANLQFPPTTEAVMSSSGKELTQKGKAKGPSEERKQLERITGKMLVEPIMRDRVARKSQYDSRTIARDVLLATGRHPEMRGLNHHLSVMQKLLGDHGGSVDSFQGESRGGRSDLATIRWNLLDPGKPIEALNEDAARGNSPNDNPNPVDGGAEADGEDLAINERLQQEKKPGRRRKKKIMGMSAEEVALAKVQDANKTSASFNGGSGRRNTFAWDSRQASQATQSIKQTPTTRVLNTAQRKRHEDTLPMSIVSRQATPTSAPTGYAAFRQLDEEGNVIKRKGRPVGWRKAIHSREAHGLTPDATGQPAKTSTSRKMDRPLQQPHYQIYACQWRDCSAELHNLDNLKKHLIKMHGNKNDVEEYECLWQGCGDYAFENLELWLGHINKQHLKPIAWKLGDGPKGGMTVTKRDPNLSEAAYLSDASGRSVTPIIIATPEDRLQSPDPLARTTSSDPTHEFDELKRHKRIVGLIFERNGCRFANAKRRKGFLDDEDFEDVIEELPGEVEPFD